MFQEIKQVTIGITDSFPSTFEDKLAVIIVIGAIIIIIILVIIIIAAIVGTYIN